MGYMRICCLGIVLIAGLARPVFADQVHMKNGDRISGEVITMQRIELIIRTSYAGEIRIKWEEVSRFTTDRAAKVVLNDERSFEGVINPTEEGLIKIEMQEPAESVSISIAEIKSINPEPPAPTRKVEVSADIGWGADRGNTVKDNLRLDGQFLVRRDEHRVKLGADIEYEENFGNITKNKGLGYLEYNYLVTEKQYLFGRSLVSYDKFKDLRSRNTLDAGLGYQFLETPLTNLFIEAGLSGVREEYRDRGGAQEFPAITWTLNYDRWFLNKHLQFFHNQRVYVGLDTLDNSFWFTKTGIRIPLYKFIRLTFRFDYDWDDIPFRPVDNADIKFITMIGFKY